MHNITVAERRLLWYATKKQCTNLMFKKRKFSMSLYPDEYEMLINTIKDGKYRRVEFVLACISSACKNNVDRAHEKLVKLHNEKAHEEKAIRENQTANVAE